MPAWIDLVQRQGRISRAGRLRLPLAYDEAAARLRRTNGASTWRQLGAGISEVAVTAAVSEGSSAKGLLGEWCSAADARSP